jgi:cysteine desulfurase
MDNAATTPLCDAAKKAIIEHLDTYGNPSSSHELGRQSRLLIENARERIAKCINAEPEQIFFTSGGSEANTWALNHKFVLASPIEHHSVRLDYQFQVDKYGIVDPQEVLERIKLLRRQEKYLTMVSCMHVNNELGVIEPVRGIAKIAHECNLPFHVDAVQSVGHLAVDVKELNCDFLSASGHKFGAMKGTGFLFAKDNSQLITLINGGKQEQGKRPGTENLFGIISMAAAFEDSVKHMENRNEQVKHLRDRLLNKLLQIDGSHLNGSLENRTASNINIRFDGVSGSRLVTLCSLYGLCISSGSACNEGIATPSHVLKAIGLSDEEALSSIRITLSHENIEQEVDTAADIITSLVERMREDGT